MYKIISVTNRRLADDFFGRIEEISRLNIPIILREKDLTCDEYYKLAKRVLEITDNVILHTFTDVANKLNHGKIHLPMHIFESGDFSEYDVVGVSTHSVEEGIMAQNMGASYVTAGHIFETDCKKGVPPRGTEYLKNVCNAVDIPVYAIGGIAPENIAKTADAGAAGVCVMSSFMNCDDLEAEYRALLNAVEFHG